MPSLKFVTSNISSFSNNVPAFIIGKNGFSTELGVVPVLVTSVTKVDVDSNIEFTIRGLNDLYDPNNGTHLLENNNFIGSQQINYKILLNDLEGEEGEVAFTNPYVSTSSNIEWYSLSNSTLKIHNFSSGGTDVFSKLESTPFYAKLFQPLSTQNFGEKFIYVTGTDLKSSKTYNIFGVSGTYIAELGMVPESKKFITLLLDGVTQESSAFDWSNGSNISVTLSNNYSRLQVKYSKYTVPTIELGDNISILFNNVHSISNSTYVTGSVKYNSALTTNSFFGVYLADNLNVNATAFVATNISPNPIGKIGNVYEGINTFTFDYSDATYPGLFNLANNYVYRLIQGNKYTSISLGDGRTLYDVPRGTVSVRARNINSTGRKSPYSTSTIDVAGSVLPAVENLTVTESLYYDTTQGVAVRATISFDFRDFKNIQSYEISYKIEGETADLSSFSTVQVPTTARDPITGKIRFVINNIDRGRISGVNNLVVRVTPINNDLVGVTKQIIHPIIGKTAPPDNVTDFSFAQNGSQITLFWEFSLNSDNTLKDIDLQEVEIRRVAGIVAPGDYSTSWNTATYQATIAIPTTNHSFFIDSYGIYTYLIKARDTSRIESVGVMGFNVNLLRPSNLAAYKVWSEDDPSANNSVAFVSNSNYSEYYWPSFANSDNGGFSYAIDDPSTPGVDPSTLVENANGTSSGWSVGAEVTDLYAAANAFYQTQVRDVGSIVSGKISVTANITSLLTSSWLSMRENLVFGVSDVSIKNNVLWDAGSYIGSMLLSNGVSYNSENKTLVSSDSYGNVYAIWNSGQFGNDISNANSFALIAGVINANAVALSLTYSAGGIPTNTNVFTNVSTKASSYQLVNLKQWGDPEGLGTWQGPDSVITYNVQIRYSSDNVYFANGNVNVETLTSNGVFDTHNSSDITFRWFQLKLNVINSNPNLASTALDKFSYVADLTEKTYSALVTVATDPTIVQFPQIGFKQTPIITLTPIVDSPLRVNNSFPSYSSINSNASQANITVYDKNGNFVPDVSVNMQLKGF